MRTVTSGVPLWLVLGSILFNTFKNDPEGGAECTLRNSAADTRLGGAADTPDGYAVIQRDLDTLRIGQLYCFASDVA